MIITSTEQLTDVCRRFALSDFIAIDTEFIREKTFYPELCLIQTATLQEAYCIDPLAGVSLDPLFELFQNPNITKVFHAARQDIEIIFHLSGKIPHPIFDTQIGAMACGFGENISYQQLVKSLLNIDLDKSMRYTDWNKRPLTDKQVQYALCDVIHLCPAYQHILKTLQNKNRLEWISNELSELMNPDLYNPTDEQLTEKAKTANLKGFDLYIYQMLYVMRENLARKKNKPRRFLIKDELLHELALIRPTTPEKMKNIRNLPKGFEKSDTAQAIFKTIAKALTEKQSTSTEKNVLNLNSSQKNLVEILRVALHVISAQEKVAASLIASGIDLENFTCGQDVPFNHGWRYNIFGETAQRIKNGQTGLFYHPQTGKIQFVTAETLLTN